MAIENVSTINNIDKKSLETKLLITICHQSGDKWQLKTLFLSIFDPRLPIVKRVFDCRLPDVYFVAVMFCHNTQSLDFSVDKITSLQCPINVIKAAD